MNEQLRSEPGEERTGPLEVLVSLYRQKKEIGKDTLGALKVRFREILDRYKDVLEEQIEGAEPKTGADKGRLSLAAKELKEAEEEILKPYRAELEEINRKIKELEADAGDALEDRDVLILRTESRFMGDDLVFRPGKEAYHPTIRNIEEFLK